MMNDTKKVGYIYRTTNTINGRVYVGKKHSDIFVESYYGSGMLLKRSIEKRGGTDHLICEVLEWVDQDLLDHREKVWVRYHKIKGYDLYNIAEGGTGGNTIKYKTPEEKTEQYRKVKETKVKNGTLFDTDETKQKKSTAAKSRIKQSPWSIPDNKGRIYSEKGYANLVKAAGKRKGEITITDGIIEKKINPDDQIPDGFRKGRCDKMLELLRSQTSSEETKKKKSIANKGNRCYTNGTDNKWIQEGESPPAGWTPGMTKRKKQ